MSRASRSARRWKYAAGTLDFDHLGFVHTVLVDMREHLRRSERPHRIFEAVICAAREAGLLGRRRVLDSTALYDAVATRDTVTLVRSALVGLLAVVDRELAAEMHIRFERGLPFPPGRGHRVREVFRRSVPSRRSPACA